nr:immunoglobulin heavy chain junction region [Macaca mulatta]MOW76178.1 immunoglobulin heavy chain junction region [Macaca mulatta]MOW76359.1 immunoglobulin heavy chain junction region [Macaca mulatta]MOW76502.1 immunoglobulin heavy chain junction region [Macaca mulatta]MOW76845.1 immunoglobulin heavy chain junction region [Macaca mulatta]
CTSGPYWGDFNFDYW